MPCFRPMTLYRAAGGGMTGNKREACSPTPLTIPCGKCRYCRLRHAQGWTLRCTHEARMHAKNCFITLTYNDENLPSDGSLNVVHFQKFIRRCRKAGIKLRYYHCGEYGDLNLRPHYHALIFGYEFGGRSVHSVNKSSQVVYRSEELDELWPMGYNTVGALSWQSASYVCRYVMKKVDDEDAADSAVAERQSKAKERYRRVNTVTGEEYFVKAEYCTMSRRPGIGSEWMKRYHKDVFPGDFIVHEGRKIRVPRYYDDLHAIADEAMVEEVKARRVRAARERGIDDWKRLREREQYSERVDEIKERGL